jgi:hypothetical protein
VREYVAATERYEEEYKEWRDRFGRVGKPPERPATPQYLSLWFELQRWPNQLLVAGGLFDQPAWTWSMINYAGQEFLEVTEENRRVREIMKKPGAKQDG